MKNAVIAICVAVLCCVCVACSDHESSLPTDRGWQILVDIGNVQLSDPQFPVELDLDLRVEKIVSGEPAPDGTPVVLRAPGCEFSNGLETIEISLANGEASALITFSGPGFYEISIEVLEEETTFPLVFTGGA